MLCYPILFKKVKTLIVMKETYNTHCDQECMMLQLTLDNYILTTLNATMDTIQMKTKGIFFNNVMY